MYMVCKEFAFYSQCNGRLLEMSSKEEIQSA